MLGLVSALLAVVLWSSDPMERAEYITWYWRVKFFAEPVAESEKIKLILLDQESLDWGKKVNKWGWPWPREVYTVIIDFCLRNKAKVIAFDVLFSEPSVYGVEDDRSLGEAIKRAPAFISALATRQGDETTWPLNIRRNGLNIEGLESWLREDRRRQVGAERAAFPIPEVAQNAGLLANVSHVSDQDGIFRRLNMFRIFDNQPLPSLALAAYLMGEREKSKTPFKRMRITEGSLWLGQRKIPIDSFGRTILRYRGPARTYQAFSAAAVIQSELRILEGKEPTIRDAQAFKDCYVFFGFSAPGLKDRTPTPLNPEAPGVEVHATQLDNLISNQRFQDFMRGSSRPLVMGITVVVTMLASTLVRVSPKIWHGIIISAVFFPLPLFSGFIGYRYGLWWPIVVQELALLLALGSTIVINYIMERHEKAFIKKAFSHYLSPAVIARLLEDPSKLNLGGERRELSIFFSDLQGFSSISERLDPQALTQLLNDYLSDMTEIILEEGGTLDKYEGDAIIAFWNAPLAQRDHALRACRACIRCQRKLDERREEFRERTGADFRMRIGLNTGSVVVGNMGSKKRFDYTMLGDAANLASRLEGANKAFRTYIMVADETRRGAEADFDWRLIGLIRVVGRTTPVTVYEIMGAAGEVDQKFLEDFKTGVSLCGEERWTEALVVYEKYPTDPVAQKYIQRCREVLASPLKSWDGVWNLTEK
ncbi:MAG: adenylate/guanylate cyclase domain-containing protein [Pseudomonadota bacterium]